MRRVTTSRARSHSRENVRGLDYRDLPDEQITESRSVVAAAGASGDDNRNWSYSVQPPLPLRNGALSPKRPSSENVGLSDIFPYYAGFSFGWACDQLAEGTDPDSTTVLDPWNGSGTTTLAARSTGLRSIGVDLNPMASVVARLRATASDVQVAVAAPSRDRITCDDNDPLFAWLTKPTVERLRAWTQLLCNLPPGESALCYVALFRVVRNLTKKFEGSNPTWVRRARNPDDLIHVDDDHIDLLLRDEQKAIISRLSSQPRLRAPVLLITASATKLPIADESIDIILTSPPYLTRIDYAVAYARELAVLDVNISADRDLRESLMGTTLIRSSQKSDLNLGPTAQELLANVSQHRSRASSGYYKKQFEQYLSDLTASFDQITRVANQGATMVLVVQDSYYKEIPIGLAVICGEEAARRGWQVADSQPFPVRHNLTTINKAARAYTKGVVVETVITLRKARS
jgi:hypothetical protein